MENFRASTNAAAFDSANDDVFSRIAGRYDLLCDLFSFWIHRHWKRQLARRIAAIHWTRALDVATGTGDIPLRVLRLTGPLQSPRESMASDLSPGMLDVAGKRIALAGLTVPLRQQDAQTLPDVPDRSLDLLSIAFALKICDRAAILAQARRVLKPGGTLLILEASRMRPEWLHRLYLRYMDMCMPLIGWLASGGDASVYSYLLKGVHEFPDARTLAGELSAAGFSDVQFRLLSAGIVALHEARV